LSNVNAPSPRDRHSAVVHENKIIIFGGFDGITRVDDMHAYDLINNRWETIYSQDGTPPTARHSHSAVKWKDCLYIFGGYDGSYRSDFHEFNFSTLRWTQVSGAP
jgi:N-acetylneuraminic acid mutarotase